MKRYTLLLIAAGLCFTACNSNEKTEKTDSLQYVYVDAAEVLHVDNKCEDICKTTYGTKPVNVYPVSQIYYVEYEYICSSCVNENSFDDLHIKENYIKSFYDFCVRENFVDMPTFDVFVKNMKDPDKIKTIYFNLVHKFGYIMPPYEDFCREMGVNYNTGYLLPADTSNLHKTKRKTRTQI